MFSKQRFKVYTKWSEEALMSSVAPLVHFVQKLDDIKFLGSIQSIFRKGIQKINIYFQDYDLRDTFDLERKFLLYCGLYPNNGKIVMKKSLHYLTSFYHILSMIFIFISMTILIGTHITHLFIIADALSLYMTETATMLKLFNLLIKRKQLVEIEKLLSNPIFYGYSDKNIRTIKSFINSTRSFALAYRLSCIVVCGAMIIFPMFDNDLENLRPVMGWYPWGAEDKVKLIIYFAFHMLACCTIANLNSSIDLLICMLMTVAASLFQMLKNNLADIKYDAKDAKHLYARNVRLHCEILRLSDYINASATLNRGLNVLNLCARKHNLKMNPEISVALFGIRISTNHLKSSIKLTINNNTIKWVDCAENLWVPVKSMQFISLLFYLTCMLIQVTMYCWYGHSIIESSGSLGQTIYMTNWYEADKSLKKSIFIFMEKCKQPTAFSGGYYFPLSLVTFSGVSTYLFIILLTLNCN
ncbi:hypothetical protein NQ314_006209 [Rhamnusium bicolor]|uniref:Odorant receptor n=1 Tax=Rhamnusium bicolor TaxID=1586634 RepID=A0AAV8Z913_9CUCU|nr:hypothetical protein NQ314_006209 [Rhamnusium bicolor]